MTCCFRIAALCFALFAKPLLAAELPAPTRDFLVNYCLDCHDADTEKGEINLDAVAVDWSDHANLQLWERVLKALEAGEMPPAKKPQPTPEIRSAMLAWVDRSLSENTLIGGTLARRLNQTEYLNTVRASFGLKDFALPPGFPVDSERHGFDNLGEGLVLSPPLLDAYTDTANRVADQLFPPSRPAPVSAVWEAAAQDLAISYSSGSVRGDALRLGLKCDPMQRSCTWPSRIEAPASGVYTITLKLSSFRPKPDEPMRVRILARDFESSDGTKHTTLRLLHEIEVTSEAAEEFRFEAELYEGQTPVVHWANAPLDSDRTAEDKAALKAWFEQRNENNPRYLSAWHHMIETAAITEGRSRGQGFRGGSGWERVKALLAREELPEITNTQRAKILKTIIGNPVLYAETAVFDVFENGPSLEVHCLKMEGPHKIIDGPRDKERQRIQARFLGNRPAGASDETWAREILQRILTAAFRRPVDGTTLGVFLRIVLGHQAEGHSFEDGLHLAIRNALISPRFLYRALKDGRLDDHDLATRLAYFLTSAPPDEKLLRKAQSGRLTDPGILADEARRLLPTSPSAPFVQHFTGQWLDTRVLLEIMPDPRFKFTAADTDSARKEVEMFFSEMLRENRAMTDFIDPDFTYVSGRLAKNIYELKKGYNAKSKSMQRISLQRGSRHGGVLGQAAVLMATANGVDTQPVLRGVWVLENILGAPPPPPPKAVPALTPDTNGATTPRELLAAHTTEKSCAACHKRIDPVGFALENFDPVGRWRDKWPGVDVPVDASSVLPDGTRIKDVIDLKRWIVENIDQFSSCLAAKLMTYATGRVPNYSERKEIDAIVKANANFRDLLLALIQSETFRTK